MGLSLANRTRLWQEQSSVDPPIDAIGLDWGLYRAGPLVEADILTSISSRYNGELDAAPRRGASLHKKMLPIKMVDRSIAGSSHPQFVLHSTPTVPGLYLVGRPSAASLGTNDETLNGLGSLAEITPSIGAIRAGNRFLRGGARDNAGCRYSYSFPFTREFRKVLAVEGMQPGRVGRLDDD